MASSKAGLCFVSFFILFILNKNIENCIGLIIDLSSRTKSKGKVEFKDKVQKGKVKIKWYDMARNSIKT